MRRRPEMNAMRRTVPQMGSDALDVRAVGDYVGRVDNELAFFMRPWTGELRRMAARMRTSHSAISYSSAAGEGWEAPLGKQ